MIFLKISFALFTPKVRIIHEKCHLFFLFENGFFTLSLSTSSSSIIYKIVIAINTPTTMNNKFEALNASKIELHSFFLISYELKTTSLLFSLYIH